MNEVAAAITRFGESRHGSHVRETMERVIADDARRLAQIFADRLGRA